MVTNEGEARTLTSRSLSVEEVKLGVAVSDDTFTLAFPMGTQVLLNDVGETYTAGVTGPR